MAAAADKTIHQRLVAILEEMPAIGKNQRNEQQGFMFRGHDDVLNALNPLMAKHGVIYVPNVIDRVTSQRTTSSNKVMFEVSLHVGFRFYGAGGDYVEGSTWGEGTDMGDKATSKAMTMAFKSALNQTFAISNAETEDPDRQSPEPSAKKDASPAEPPAPPVSAGDAASNGDDPVEVEYWRLLDVCDELGVDAATREAVVEHRADAEWLRNSLVTAESNLAKLKEAAESSFQAPVPK